MKRFAAAFVAIDETDEQRGAGQPCSCRCSQHLEILRNEPRFEEEILRRITGNGQLGRKNEIGAGGRELIVSGEDFVEVTPQIADGGIDLGETDFHPRD